MKKYIILLIVVLSSFKLIGQTQMNFIQLDTLTYKAYVDADWNKLIKNGEQALDGELDYYYLRLRLAYAYYKKQQYRRAIPHLKQALVFSQNDVIASELLYYCFLYSGRETDAIKLKSGFNDALKLAITKGEEKIFYELGGFLSYQTGVSETNQVQNATDSIIGSQVVPNQLIGLDFYIKHKMGASVLVRHYLDFQYKDAFAKANVEDTSVVSESLWIRQFNYHLAIDITPVYGVSITPVMSYVNYRIPVFYEFETTAGNSYKVKTEDIYNEFIWSLKLQKQFEFLKSGIAATTSNLNGIKQSGYGLQMTFYPFGNLNLYYSGALFLHQQKYETEKETAWIHSHRLGVKLTKKLWLEGLLKMGDFRNFYDPFDELIYNSLERYHSISGLNLIIPFSKKGSSVFLGFRNFQSETIFVPTEEPFNISNTKNINYQTITGGIQWKL
jgi:tetratricopeptide (TPR) repeat protein